MRVCIWICRRRKPPSFLSSLKLTLFELLDSRAYLTFEIVSIPFLIFLPLPSTPDLNLDLVDKFP